MATLDCPAFYRLPKELYLEIFRWVSSDASRPKVGCRALRLAHPHFGHLDGLKAFLFHTVVLRPSRERLADLSSFRTIAQYVKHLDVEPVPLWARATLKQVTALLSLIVPSPCITLRDSPKGMLRSTISQDAFYPQALLLADLLSQCLIQADLRPRGLNLHYCGDLLASISEQESWQNCDLSQLQSLEYTPSSNGSLRHADRPRRDRPQERNRNPQEITQCFLILVARCSASLETLVCHDTGQLMCFWQTTPLIALPSLRKITLRGLRVNQLNFMLWLNLCTALEHVHLANLTSHSYADTISHWRLLFNGFRHLPNRLHITIDDLFYHPWRGNRLSLKHYTGMPAEDTTHLHKRERCMARVKMCMKIKNYMSGREGWMTDDEEALFRGHHVEVSDAPSDCCLLKQEMGRR